MSGDIVLNTVQRQKLKNAPIESYVLNIEDMQQYSSVVIKSNAIIDMELYGRDDQNLYGMDVQVLSTAFLMAQCLKQQRASFDANTVFTMPLSEFCELWKVPFNNETRKRGFVYREIMDSVSRLNQRMFTYPDISHSKMVESGYFSYIKYDKATVEFGFPLPIIDYINQDNHFTWYFLENVIRLQEESQSFRLPQYSLLLYEYIQKSKFKSRFNAQKVAILDLPSADLRKIMGVEPSKYKRHIDFRVKVLDQAVKFIFDRVGMRIDVENLSLGKRGINGYRFIAYMSEADLDFVAAINKAKEAPIMTISQRMKFAPQLIAHTTFDAMYRQPDESNPDFIQRVEALLLDNDNVVEYENYLRAVGFKSKKLDAYLKKLDSKIKDAAKDSDSEDADMGEQACLPLDDPKDAELPF